MARGEAARGELLRLLLSFQGGNTKKHTHWGRLETESHILAGRCGGLVQTGDSQRLAVLGGGPWDHPGCRLANLEPNEHVRAANRPAAAD